MFGNEISVSFVATMKTINLSQGKQVLVDDVDYMVLSEYKWSAKKDGKTFYAVNRKLGLMHRFILQAKKGQLIDHADRNGLNNQRNNIKLCTVQENNDNRSAPKSSDIKGVWFCGWVKSTNKWRATAWNKKLIHLGMFPSEIEAAKRIENFKAEIERK